MKRTIGRFCSDFLNGRKRIRVVVLGSTNCGKTVFLTALASHLRNHDPKQFSLNGWEAYWDETMLPKDRASDLPLFPYAEYRHEFEKEPPEFPEKTTTEMNVLRLPLVLKKDNAKRSVLLECLDLPGERVADLVMAHKDYREWCVWMHDNFVTDKLSESFSAYRKKLLDMKEPTAEDLFTAYKEHLLKEYKQYSPWITPSSVKLADGSAKEFEKKLGSRWLGCDKDSQFVPLPVEAFGSGHALHKFVKEFATGYRVYRRTIVGPLVGWMAEADQLLYLVDVLGILRKGGPAYDAESAFGREVIGMFKRRQTRSVLRSVVEFCYGLFKTRVKSAYLVTTKADLAYGQTGRENMCNLARQILGKPLRNLGLETSELFIRACAAVKTVTDDATARQNRDSIEETAYERLVVPERWPESREWDPAKYWFEDTFPRFDGRRDAVPPQNGLDDLVCSVLKDCVR